MDATAVANSCCGMLFETAPPFLLIATSEKRVDIAFEGPSGNCQSVREVLACSIISITLCKPNADGGHTIATQARSSKEEWMARGDNLMDNLRFEFAARAYTQAGDAVRATAAWGRHHYHVARELAGDSVRRQACYLDVRAPCARVIPQSVAVHAPCPSGVAVLTHGC